jgi:hypothetical protein
MYISYSLIHVDNPQANGAERSPGRKGTNSARFFTPGEMKVLAKSKVHQWSRAWVTDGVGGQCWVGGHPHWSQKYGGLSWIANIDC